MPERTREAAQSSTGLGREEVRAHPAKTGCREGKMACLGRCVKRKVGGVVRVVSTEFLHREETQCHASRPIGLWGEPVKCTRKVQVAVLVQSCAPWACL